MKIKDVEVGKHYQYSTGRGLRYFDRVCVVEIGVHGKIWAEYHQVRSVRNSYVRVEFLRPDGTQGYPDRKRFETILPRYLVREWDVGFDEEQKALAKQAKEHSDLSAAHQAQAILIKELLTPLLPDGVRLIEARGINGLSLSVEPKAFDWLLSVFGQYHGTKP